MTDFNKIVNRRGTNCIKWDIKALEGREDVLPMWVADMDFEAAPGIVSAMEKVMNHKVFGYRFNSQDYNQVIIDWFLKRHGYRIERDWICYLPNVVAGLSIGVQTVSEPGDEIILNTPVYGPFYRAVTDNGRIVKECPMIEADGRYTMDFKAMEASITPKTKAVMLCNPHNPGGRVWTEAELWALADLCLKHKLYIISDDIHADLTYGGHKHMFIAGLSKEIEQLCITCTSPSKAFNLAGMQAAHIVIANDALREKFLSPLKKFHMTGGNSFEEALVIGAYRDSEEWLKEAVSYIEGNIDFFVDSVRENIPQLKVSKPDGTYLVWIDCRALKLSQEALMDFFLNTCGLYLNSGLDYGESGRGFVRINMACPRKYVEEALKRIMDGIKRL